MEAGLTNIAVIILAGGKGTRLYPLTLHHSKPSIFFGGNYRLIDIPISNSLNSNIRKVFVLGQYLSTELYHHLINTYRFDQFTAGTLEFLTPEERADNTKNWFEGTADAVRKNLHIFMELPVDYFLILSGDQLYNMDFSHMLEYAIEKDADLTIAALPVEKEDAKRLGILKVDSYSHIIDFVEKPQEDKVLQELAISRDLRIKWNISSSDQTDYLGSMGIYIFKKNKMKELLLEDPREDFGKHLIPIEIKKGKSFAYIYNGYWEDIGTISSFYEANMALTRQELGLEVYDEVNPIYCQQSFLPGPMIQSTKITSSLICNGSIIEAKEILGSIIGLKSKIKKGTVLKHSILAPNQSYLRRNQSPQSFGIGENCLIEKTIIDEHVLIGNNVKLVNEKKLDQFDGDGIFIRDGIIIVTAGCQIPDNFTL